MMDDDDVERIGQRRFAFKGFAAQEFIYETQAGDVRHYRSYLTPNGTITVSCRAPKDLRDPKLIAPYFDSFDILEEIPTAAAVAGERAVSEMRTWADATGTFWIKAELDEACLNVGPRAIFDGVSESLAEMMTSRKAIKIGSHPGMQFLLEFEEDGAPLVIRNRVYPVKSRLFQVMVAASREESQLAEADHFFDSFKLLVPAVDPPSGRSTYSHRRLRLFLRQTP